MSQVCNNRETITAAILDYMKGLPVPKELPREICFEIRFEKAVEKHVISFSEGEKVAPTKKELAAEVVKRYHEICGEKLPAVKIITDKRVSSAVCRLKTYGMDKLCEVFRLASESGFLCGDNDRGWRADFDWLINENNIAKVLEGKFSSDVQKVTRAGTKTATSFDVDEALKKSLGRVYG